MERLLNRVGYAIEWMTGEIRQAAHLADEFAERPRAMRESLADLADDLGGAVDSSGTRDLIGSALPLAASALGGWLASRLLRPRDVNLPRAVLAGVIGTLLYDAAEFLDRQLSGRNFDTIRPLGEALTDREELRGIAGWTAHYTGGIALAIVYARFVHGRLPVPGVVQGAAFGAVDAVTLEWGGVLPLLHRLAPDSGLPAGYGGLATRPGLGARSLALHVVYGAAVGAVYRDD